MCRRSIRCESVELAHYHRSPLGGMRRPLILPLLPSVLALDRYFLYSAFRPALYLLSAIFTPQVLNRFTFVSPAEVRRVSFLSPRSTVAPSAIISAPLLTVVRSTLLACSTRCLASCPRRVLLHPLPTFPFQLAIRLVGSLLWVPCPRSRSSAAVLRRPGLHHWRPYVRAERPKRQGRLGAVYGPLVVPYSNLSAVSPHMLLPDSLNSLIAQISKSTSIFLRCINTSWHW
jgi:hypothetical protein